MRIEADPTSVEAPAGNGPRALAGGDRRPDGSTAPGDLLNGVLERSLWQRSYASKLRITDAVVVVAAVLLAQLVRFGPVFSPPGYPVLFVPAFSSLFVIGWLASLSGFHTRSARLVGTGVEEYRRVVAASFWTFGAIAIVTLLFKADIARGYLAVALPVGTVGLVLSRWAWQGSVARRRLAGNCTTAVLAFGDEDAVVNLATELTRNRSDGYRVVGVGMPGYGAARGEHIDVNGRQIPIVGGESEMLAAIRACGADTVAIAGTEHFGVRGIRRLIWDLEPLGVDLVISTGVMDVALSRLVMRPIAGLPLLHIEKPQYRGAKRFEKRAFDVCFASVVLAAASPLFALAALAIKLTSRGPVFDAAPHIGRDGQQFSLLRFRTTLVAPDQDSEMQLSLRSLEDEMYALSDEPPATPVGRILRRFSIDSLPQLLNVLRGEMSVVGPRPPRRHEVEAYDVEVLRRLLMRPGVTGLWQVGGRSDLCWNDAVRLDLSYVDNWSMTGDLITVVKTMQIPLRRSVSGYADRELHYSAFSDDDAPTTPWPRMVVGNIAVDLVDRSAAVNLILGALSEPGGLAIVSANLDHLHHFVDHHGNATRPPASSGGRMGELRCLTLLDGVPLVRRANALTGQSWPKLSGSDIILPLLKAATHRGVRVGFLGGVPTTHQMLRDALASEYPAMPIAGMWSPARDELSDPVSSRRIAAEIKEANVDILVVCLGKPRQEDWIDSFGADTGAKVLLAFGAVVDFLAGRVRRAPELVTAVGAEWAWRLMLEPRRLARRYLIQGPPSLLALKRRARVVSAEFPPPPISGEFDRGQAEPKVGAV